MLPGNAAYRLANTSMAFRRLIDVSLMMRSEVGLTRFTGRSSDFQAPDPLPVAFGILRVIRHDMFFCDRIGGDL